MKRWFAKCLGLLVLASMMLACEPTTEPDSGNDFAVLTQASEGFRQAKPGQPLSFPTDHGAHPDYRIEWWYLTANLSDERGQSYGLQWTLFRYAPTLPVQSIDSSSQQQDQLFMAHFAVTSPTGHQSYQRYARGTADPSSSRAGVMAAPFSAWLDDWTLHSTGKHWLPLRAYAQQNDNGIDIQLQSTLPPVLQGQAGFSQKHVNGGGSYYYSQPFLKANGHLWVDGRRIDVTGDAWLDREWGSQFLQSDQLGWDWFSLHLDSGEKLMLFQLRQQQTQNTRDNYTHGVLISAEGSKTDLDPEQIQLDVIETARVEGRVVPTSWQITLPQIQRSFVVSALHEDQWMQVDFPYWEGVVIVKGDSPGSIGKGYMELTGYTSGPR